MTSAEQQRRLVLLETEVGLDFEGLVPALKAGLKVVLVTDEELGHKFHPEVRRRIGGMVALCDHYGASVIFTKRERYLELNYKAAENS